MKPAVTLSVSLALATMGQHLAPSWKGDAIAAEFIAAWLLIVLPLALILWAALRLYHCLLLVQETATIGEESYIRRMTEALAEADQNKRPELALRFAPDRPPFRMAPLEQRTIKFKVNIKRGETAKGGTVWFYAPEVFDFPKSKTWNQTKGFRIPNARTAKNTFQEALLPHINYSDEIGLKAPQEKGKYTLLYRLHCEGFASDFEEFEVIVK